MEVYMAYAVKYTNKESTIPYIVVFHTISLHT